MKLIFDSLEEAKGFMEAIGTETEPVAEPKAAKKAAKKTEEPTPKKEASTEEETPKKAYTLEEVRATLTALSKGGKREEVKALIAATGAANLAGVDPRDYEELMEKAGEL